MGDTDLTRGELQCASASVGPASDFQLSSNVFKTLLGLYEGRHMPQDMSTII